MRSSCGRPQWGKPHDDTPVEYTDGGSGLFAACVSRFPQPGFVVTCDVWHTVWVKRSDDSRSFGIARWQLHTRSIGEVLEQVEERLTAYDA